MYNDPMSLKDECVPSEVFNERDLSDLLPQLHILPHSCLRGCGVLTFYDEMA